MNEWYTVKIWISALLLSVPGKFLFIHASQGIKKKETLSRYILNIYIELYWLHKEPDGRDVGGGPVTEVPGVMSIFTGL